MSVKAKDVCKAVEKLSRELSKEDWTEAYERCREAFAGSEIQRVSMEVANILFMAPNATVQELLLAVDTVLSTSSLPAFEKQTIRRNMAAIDRGG